MTLWSWLYLMVLAGVVPCLSARSMRSGGMEELSRLALYANLCISLWVLAAIGYLVVKLDGQTLADVRLTAAPLLVSGRTALVAAGWTITTTLAGLALFALSQAIRHRLGLPDESSALRRMRPTRPAEAAWILLAVSPTAGLCEEFLYRGFFLSRTDAILGSPWLSVLAAAAVFGLAHLYQGWLGASRAGTIALLLALPVLATGSVLPSMAAHTLIDAVGLLWLWPVMERGERGKKGSQPGPEVGSA